MKGRCFANSFDYLNFTISSCSSSFATLEKHYSVVVKADVQLKNMDGAGDSSSSTDTDVEERERLREATSFCLSGILRCYKILL